MKSVGTNKQTKKQTNLNQLIDDIQLIIFSSQMKSSFVFFIYLFVQ